MIGRFHGHITIRYKEHHLSSEETINQDFELPFDNIEAAREKMNNLMNDYYDYAKKHSYVDFHVSYRLEEKTW